MDLQIRTDDGSALCASKPNRKNGLENSALHILRLLCPIIIVTGHWAEPRLNYLQPIAIDVFLAAEGLLLSNLLVRTIDNSQRSAIANAIVRIYPLYLTALALGGLSTIFAVALRVDAWTWPLVIKAAANGLILAPSFSAANHNSVYPFNSPSWAIVAELWFSIALIAARKLLNLPSILAVYAISIATYVFAAFHWRDVNLGWQAESYWGGFARAATSISAGLLLGEITRRAPAAIKFGLPLSFACFFFLLFANAPSAFFKVQMVCILVGVPATVWLAAIADAPLRLVAISKRYALAVYLLGYPTVLMYRYGLPLSLGSSVLGAAVGWSVLMGSIAAIAAAAVQLVDRPLRKRGGSGVGACSTGRNISSKHSAE